MDPWMLILLAIVVLIAGWRIKKIRSTIKKDRKEEIRLKLEQLRKQREED